MHFNHCGALHRIRSALNTHCHDIKSHKICPLYHVSSIKPSIFSEKYFHQCTVQKTEIFNSWQRVCVLTCPSNNSFNVINSHHHHRTSSIQFIFLDKFIHLPSYVSLHSEGSSYRLGILVPITLNTSCLFYFLGCYAEFGSSNWLKHQFEPNCHPEHGGNTFQRSTATKLAYIL